MEKLVETRETREINVGEVVSVYVSEVVEMLAKAVRNETTGAIELHMLDIDDEVGDGSLPC